VWREAGRVNNNIYTTGQNRFNFTVDVNPASHRFRIRAVNTLGVSSDLVVNIKIRSINMVTSFTSLDVRGNTTESINYLPMTSDWDLIVGNLYPNAAGVHAIKVTANGNVGIGTTTPKEKLSVNGPIRAHEIKVETANWPDYVFDKDYHRMPLDELRSFIDKYGRLPNTPDAKEATSEGIGLGEMNRKLLEKVEELTLYLLDHKREIDSLKAELKAIRP